MVPSKKPKKVSKREQAKVNDICEAISNIRVAPSPDIAELLESASSEIPLDEVEDPDTDTEDVEDHESWPDAMDGYVRVGLEEELHVSSYFGAEWEAKIRALDAVEATPIPGLSPNIVLHPHQAKGAPQIHYACKETAHHGILVGHSMGLGKTMQTICAIKLAESEPGFSVVVAPKNVCFQWKAEVEILFTKEGELRCLVLEDSAMTAHQLHAGRYDIVIVSYEFLETSYRALRDYEIGLQEHQAGKRTEPPKRPSCALHSNMWLMIDWPIKRLVLDECQRVNKRDSARHKAVKALQYQAVILLSGTFAHNRWHDLSGVVDFLFGHPFRTHRSFLKCFGMADHIGNMHAEPTNTQLYLLQRFLMAFTIACPSSVLHLPGLEHYQHPFQLSPEEEQSVTEHVEEFEAAIRKKEQGQSGNKEKNEDPDDDNETPVSNPLVHATRAQLASLHLHLLKSVAISTDEDNIDDLDDDDDVTEVLQQGVQSDVSTEARKDWQKYLRDNPDVALQSTRVQELIKVYNRVRSVYPKEKIIITSAFLKFLDIIAHVLESKGIRALDYNGTLSKNQKIANLSAFKSEATPPDVPLLMTGGSGGVGLNIAEASVVIQAEVWWNRNAELQAYCRCHRMPQTRKVKVIRLEATNSAIDGKMKEVQVKKSKINKRLLKPLIRRHDEPPQIPPIYEVPNWVPPEYPMNATEDEESGIKV